jgi:DNA-binding PadR family transcriptional regulator
LAQRLRTRSGGAIDLPDGSLYPALQNLIKVGAVYEVRTEARRKVVALTPHGHVVAQQVLECLVRVTSRDGEA